MTRRSSPRGDTRKNTYTDLGAIPGEALWISEKSRKIAQKEIGNATPEDRIRQRCSIAVGDLAMAELLRFTRDPVTAGLFALGRRAPLITDIRMVQAGIQKRGHGSRVICALDHAGRAQAEGITRTRAGILALREEIGGAIVVIGNAPSALLSLCDLIEDGCLPALVVGTPVGFVNAAESKERLRSLPVPSITNIGTRGGTPVAVAAINEIITMYAESHPGRGHAGE
ncbi:MAG: precorrin-8X methylmutase [Methanolinea sp.]|jgi:precorrin-8X/cobalt-precorrin-8 methylmutase|nr:precorrin-8X methylmutase [Methanolinea sp.]